MVRENSPTYAAAIEEKAKEQERKQEEEMLEHGKALAEALGKRFEDVLKAVVPTGCDPAQASPGSSSRTAGAPVGQAGSSPGPASSSAFPPVPPGAAGGGVAAGEAGKILSKDRARWIQSELGGNIKLGQNKEEFVAAIKACKDRKVIEKMSALWTKNGGPSVLPRSVEARAGGLFESLVSLD